MNIREQTPLPCQTGFRSKLRTRDAILAFQRLFDSVHQRRQQEPEAAATFIDFSKAFDSIDHRWLETCLREHKVPEKLIQLIIALYKVAAIKIKARDKEGNELRSERIPINSGVLQGDILSPTLFILAFDSILRRLQKTTEPKEEVAYADDVGFLFRMLENLEATLSKLASLHVHTGLKLSFPKTKNMFPVVIPEITITEK